MTSDNSQTHGGMYGIVLRPAGQEGATALYGAPSTAQRGTSSAPQGRSELARPWPIQNSGGTATMQSDLSQTRDSIDSATPLGANYADTRYSQESPAPKSQSPGVLARLKAASMAVLGKSSRERTPIPQSPVALPLL